MLKPLGLILMGFLAEQVWAASVCPEAPSQFGNGNVLGCWTLNSVSPSGDFEDSSPNGHDAVGSGVYSVITGLDENAVSITGNGYLDVSALHDELDTSAWAISFWFRSSSADSQMVFQQTTNEYLQAVVLVGDRPGYLVQNPADTTLFLGDASSLNDGAWHHVVFTRDNSGSRPQFYVDGSSISTTRNTVAGWIPSSRFLDTTSLGSPENSLFPIMGDVDDVLLLSQNVNSANASWIYQWTLNTPPTFTSLPSFTATEDVLYTYEVAVSDPDAGQTVTLALQQGPTGMSLAGNELTWTPGNAQVGDHIVQLRAEDGFSPPVFQQFTLTVTNVNDPPVITSDPITQATEDLEYQYQVEVDDPDAEASHTYELTENPIGMTISPTGLIQWTPGDDHVGATNDVTVLVTDNENGTDTQSFTITVTNVNDAPVITSDPVTEATEDLEYQYQVAVDDPDAEASHTYELTTSPSGMTISPTGLIQWTPGDDHVGATNDVTVLVTDNENGTDTQSFTITVTNVNDAPVIISTPDTVAVVGQLYTYQMSVSDPDAGETFTYSVVSAPAGVTLSASGLLEWTPGETQTGSRDISLMVADNAGAEVEQQFSVSVKDNPPQITSTPPTTATEDVEYTYQVEVFNPDPENAITISLAGKPSGMTINNSGYISWTPTNDHVFEPQQVTVLVTDGSGFQITQPFTITVTNVNDAPRIVSTAPTFAAVNRLYSYNIIALDFDPGESLTYILSSGPEEMTLSNSGLLEWTPTSDDITEHTITVVVRDRAGAEASQTYTLNVGIVNEPPTITTSSLPPGTEDVSYSFQLEGTDPEGSALLWDLLQGPEGMTLSPGGLLEYTPLLNANGVLSLRVLASDGVQNVAQDYNLFFIPVNDPPQIDSTVPKSQVYRVGKKVSFPLTATDPEGQPLTWSLLNSPGVAYISPNSDFVWTPSIDQLGLDTLSFVVSDGELSDTLQHFALVLNDIVDVQLKNPTRLEFQVNGQEIRIDLPVEDTPAFFQVFDPLGRSLLSKTLETQGSYRLPMANSSSKSWVLLTLKTPKRQMVQKIRF